MRGKGKAPVEELFASYGDLAKRLLPGAARITLFDGDGRKLWTAGAARIPARELPALLGRSFPAAPSNLSRSRSAGR